MRSRTGIPKTIRIIRVINSLPANFSFPLFANGTQDHGTGQRSPLNVRIFRGICCVNHLELQSLRVNGSQDILMESPRILIADDQPHVLDALRLLLKGEGFIPEAVSSPSAVMQAVQSRSFDVLLLDLNYARDTTSGGEGLELLSRIRHLDSSLPVVLMTAWASIELAVQAMQSGGRVNVVRRAAVDRSFMIEQEFDDRGMPTIGGEAERFGEHILRAGVVIERRIASARFQL